MARPRKTDSYFKDIIDEFAAELASTLTRFIAVQAGKSRPSGKRPGRRPGTLCYVPGCKNIAAPRYGMFCVAEHRNLSKAAKLRYRALHEKKKMKRRAPAGRGRRARRSSSKG